MTQNQKDVKSITNQFGVRLQEVRQASQSLHDLLSDTSSPMYNSRLNGDRKTIAKLRYWRFNEHAICNILRHYRSRGRNKEAIHSLVQETALTEINPISASLGRALIESSKDNDGRPNTGVDTIRDIQDVFGILGEKTTTSEIIDSGFPKGGAETKSAKRRVQRGLNILEQAGYVSHKEVGQLYIWYDEGLSSLSLPEYSQEDFVVSN